MRYKTYAKLAPYSYTLGIFPTIELLEARPDIAERVVYANNASDNSKGLARLRQLCNASDTPFEQDEKLIRRVAPHENCFVIGFFSKFVVSLEVNQPHIVVLNPSDTGNLGTIMRTMLGFGQRNLALISPAVDAFNPKVVRASMGALFKLRFAYFTSFQDYTAAYARRQLYFFTPGSGRSLEKQAFKPPYSLVFGNEGSGLPANLENNGTSIKIAQTDEIDSLNLAVSVGIALHAAFTNKTI